jgi:hypothetical protein
LKTPKLTLLALSLLITLPTLARARISIGNGGLVVACTQNDGSLTREALDLFEGRALFGYEYPQVGENIDPATLARAWARRLDEAQGSIPGVSVTPDDSISQKLEYIMANLRFLPPGFDLELTRDTREFIKIPANCKIEQGVNFRNPKQIYADADIWDRFTPHPLNQAAMFLHEAVYWYLRDHGLEEDSRRTRKTVSFTIGQGELRVRDELPVGVTRVQYCHSRKRGEYGDWTTKLLAFRESSDRVTLQFLQLGGYRMLARAALRGSAPGTELAPLAASAKEPLAIAGDLDSPIDFEAHVNVSWGGGTIAVDGQLQLGTPVRDALTCEMVDVAP